MKTKTCKWEYIDDVGNDYYETDCNNAHCFFDGTVKENKYKFCPYCGKEIEVVK